MFAIILRPDAANEYEEAVSWYALRGRIAADKFVEAVQERLLAIASDPLRYKRVFRDYREVSTRKYPYGIVYYVEDDLIVVVAIYHHRRNPKKRFRR